MIKTDVPFQRILDILLPGALFSVGTWYILREFIEIYFPIVASVSDGSAQFLTRLPILLLTSVIFGLVIDHLSDIAIAGTIRDRSKSEKAQRPARRLLSVLIRAFIIRPIDDPRVRSVRRYISSERKSHFLKMVHNWAFTDESKLVNDSEVILAHQHVIARLRSKSEFGRNLVESAYADTSHASSLFTAMMALSLVSLIKYPTYIVFERIDVNLDAVRILFDIAPPYMMACILGYIVKRRFSDFCSKVLTLALHFYEESVHGQECN